MAKKKTKKKLATKKKTAPTKKRAKKQNLAKKQSRVTKKNVAKKNSSSNRGRTGPDIGKRIHEFILAKFLEGEDPINLTDSTPLVSGGIIDSMNSLKLGVFLEKAFSIDIAPEELTNPEN